MSTNSQIIVEREDGQWAVIYCHFDGYIAHNGRILATHYNTQELAEAVVSFGDISFLDVTLDTSVSFYRDRDETVEIKLMPTLEDALPLRVFTQYIYVWQRHDQWYIRSRNPKAVHLLPLKDFV